MGLQEVEVGNPEPNKLKRTLHLLSSHGESPGLAGPWPTQQRQQSQPGQEGGGRKAEMRGLEKAGTN